MSQTRHYLIRRVNEPVRLSPEAAVWEQADRLSIEEYPWYKGGRKQGTDVAVLYDDQALYALFVCEDAHIYSVETKPNGSVYLDSCVEFFCEPEPGRGYFNFEANCCGTMHLGFGPGRPGRKLSTPEIQKAITIATSIPTAAWPGSPNDDGWWLAARLPFDAISKFAGFAVSPRAGTAWRANFYRCGGKIDDQLAAWNPIELAKPDFHCPQFFGNLSFE